MEILSLISQGADMLFTFSNFGLLIISVCIGIVAGSIPGLSSSNTSAVLLPLTLGMSTEGALIFIAGIYCGAQYGGSIPAVLLKTPGTTGAGATTIDGFPMSQQGKGDVALGIALASSSIGGAMAAVVSLFVVIPIAKIALEFGPAEVFLLALLGLSVIAAVLGKDVKKGLLSGLIGLLISTMPSDPLLGLPRLNFGLFELYDEFPMIPAMIGLFSVSALIELVGQKSVSQNKLRDVGKLSQVIEGFKETIKRPGAIIRSAFIGLVVGILPGAGIDIASFLSYGQAKIWSKSPKDSFGKGNPEGIIAAEAANNGVTAGAMVPALALGVPGSATTAVLLAALMLHGITPGPQVIRNFPDASYALFLSVLFASIMLVPFGMFYNKLVSRITVINMAYLLPAVLSICLVGAYAVRMFVLDMYLFLIFGALGYVMTKNDYPYVPLILGLVMGPLAEKNFVRAIAISRGDFSIFFSSSISIVMWIIIGAVLIIPQVLTRWRESKR